MSAAPAEAVIVRLMRHPAFREAVLPRAYAKRIHSRLVSLQPSVQRGFETKLRATFTDLGEHVAGVYQEVERPLREGPEIPHDAYNLVEHILTSSALKDWAASRMAPRFRDHWSNVLAQTAKALRREGADPRAAASQRILEQGGRRAGLVDIVGDTRSALFRALDQSMAEGMNPRETARLIREIVPEGRFVNAGRAYRAQLIARTETMHAQRAASLENYHTMNKVRYVVAFDGDSDEDCSARNGEIFTVDDAAIENDSDTVHPNCVLAWGPVAGP